MRLHWKKEWTVIVLLYLVLRIVYSGLGAVIASGPAPEPLATGPIYDAANSLLHTGRFSQIFVNVWLRWDTGWFLKIAAFGYGVDDNSTAFLPLYPLLIRITQFLFHIDYLGAALIVANLNCIICLILLYEVALQEYGNANTALNSIFFFAFFPTAFFVFTAYTELSFFVFLLSSWLLARRRKWLPASILAGLATACRVQGIIMTPVLLWMYLVDLSNCQGLKPLAQVRLVYEQFTNRRGLQLLASRLKKPVWLFPFIPLLVYLAYDLVLWQLGYQRYSTSLAVGWGNTTVMPWKGAWLLIERLVSQPRVFIDYIDFPLFLLAISLTIFGVSRLDPALSLYNVLVLSMTLMSGTRPHLMDSFSRYFLSLFPLFIWIPTVFIRKRWLQWGILLFSFALQTFLLLGFLDWRWIA